MLKLRSLQGRVYFLQAVVMILVAGGVSVASNMGFKMNKAIVIDPDQNLVNQPGKNFVSLPYNNPYATAQDLCNQTGLVQFNPNPPPFGTPGTTILFHVVEQNIPPNAADDVNRSCVCGQGTACQILPIHLPGALQVGPNPATNTWALGLQIREPNVAGAVSSIIIVGSHDPTQAVKCLHKGNFPPENDCDFSVPYHTTAVTPQDLCNQAGLTNFNPNPPPFGTPGATVARLNATTGVFQTGTCGTSSATSFNLILGEFAQIRESVQNSVTFVPAHF